MTRRVRPCILFVCVALVASSASAIMLRERVEKADPPVDRLIRNIKSFIANHPNDPDGPYTLGRLNYLAFVRQSTELLLPAKPSGLDPAGGPFHLPDVSDADAVPGAKASPAKLETYLRDAIANLHRAISMRKANPLYFNTLASALEQGSSFADRMRSTNGFPPGSEPKISPELRKKFAAWFEAEASSDYVKKTVAQASILERPCEAAAIMPKKSGDERLKLRTRCWKELAIDAFRTAFQIGYERDAWSSKLDDVTIESGNGFLRLVRERGPRRLETNLIRLIESELTHHVQTRSLPETPIVFVLEPQTSLSALVSNLPVLFDLDASGRTQHWEWVRPETGLLVWDPRGRAEITSGTDLIGALAFEMFWRDGYRALDALDDNRDGVLSGDELHGLAVWFDRNSDGKSTKEEVVSVEALGIIGLATEATGMDGEAPMNAQGLRLRDGRTLPTWDWISHPRP